MVPREKNAPGFTPIPGSVRPVLAGHPKTQVPELTSLGRQMLTGGAGGRGRGGGWRPGEGMQIAVMNYASASASHTFEAE